MTYLKKYGLRLAYTIASVLISVLLLTTLYYFDIVGANTYKILKVVVILINIFISSFILGGKVSSKGYLEGLKLAGIIIPIFFILSILTSQVIKLRIILYYLIVLFTSIFGSMVGISHRKDLVSK